MAGRKQRNRIYYLLAALVVIASGLGSRRFTGVLPGFVAEYAGDTLWALLVFTLIAIVAARWSTLRVGLAALLLSYAIELSQLYHAPWIDAIRHTTFGGLVLGFGFLWSDLVCYTVGVGIGVGIEILISYRYLNIDGNSS